MQLLLTYLRTTVKNWRDNRFLKRHGCTSWEQYNRTFDPDYNIRASRVKDYYHGYPFVHCFENHKHIVYEWGIHIDGIYWLSQWCNKHCKGKYRFDFQRIIKNWEDEWEVNELGGTDYIFVAFKEQRDYTWFMLRWSDDHSRLIQ